MLTVNDADSYAIIGKQAVPDAKLAKAAKVDDALPDTLAGLAALAGQSVYNASVKSRRTALNFGLTTRALAFARFYAENPRDSATECALRAGYARRCARGAHVRANELLRDPRVIRAVIYFGAKALNNAMSEAHHYLARVATTEGRYWNYWDKNSFNRLAAQLKRLEIHMQRIEDIYESGLSALPIEVYVRSSGGIEKDIDG